MSVASALCGNKACLTCSLQICAPVSHCTRPEGPYHAGKNTSSTWQITESLTMACYIQGSSCTRTLVPTR